MFTEKLKGKNLILASRSPRRQQLMSDLGVDFKIKVKEIEENYSNELKGKEITDFLAQLKARMFGELGPNDILITSDTIVWFKGQALEKPKSKEEAKNMIKKMSGKKHKVYTSICLRSKEKEVVFNDATTVYFKDLTDDEIDFYVKNYNPMDKAGSYGIQEWIGLIGVKKIKGSYFNVMGFPVHKLYKELMKF